MVWRRDLSRSIQDDQELDVYTLDTKRLPMQHEDAAPSLESIQQAMILVLVLVQMLLLNAAMPWKVI